MHQVYEPRVGDFDVRLFLSLTQADAYNPLIVGTSKFALPSEDVASAVSLPSSSRAGLANALWCILTVAANGERTCWSRITRLRSLSFDPLVLVDYKWVLHSPAELVARGLRFFSISRRC